MATLKRNLFGDSKVIVSSIIPINQHHLFIRYTRRYLDRHTVAKQLIGPHVRLIKGYASGIRDTKNLLNGRGNLCIAIPTPFKVSL